MVLEGEPSTISSMKADPTAGVGETGVKQILIVDNQLTRTFVPTKQLAKEFGQPPAVAMERIPIFQRTPASGQPIAAVGMPLRIDPFDEWGHRLYSMVGPRGRTVDLVQGITEVTPRWTKVEAIEGIHHYILTMKIATSSIPREQLSKILSRTIDPKNPDQRLRIVRLYLQSERYLDAHEELKQLIADFPNLAHLNDQVKELRQLGAQTLLKEIELRADAGQFGLAISMLESFPSDGVAGETLLKVRELLDELKGFQAVGHKALKLIDDNVAALKADSSRKELAAIVSEIKGDLNINTLDRMADFLRLADDQKMSPEQKMSLAISGWLLGSGSGIDNLGVSTSLVQVRDLIRQYMNTTRDPERKEIIARLTSVEGATMELVVKILAHMKPPVATTIVEIPPADIANPAAILGLPGAVAPQGQPVPNNQKKDDNDSCAPPKGDDSALLKGTPKAAATVPNTATDPPPAPTSEKTPPPADDAPKSGTAMATPIPGLYKLIVASTLSEDPQFEYWVQLPPDYDPYRRYPCIVTLHGAATGPLQQLDWWAGEYKPGAKNRYESRYGQATRHGYIVLAPRWSREHQQEYEFSRREHASVLLPLRDACKRFSIDVDRVFLTGHSMGGTAAWDIGLSHPDLWAGVMPIVATPPKYNTQDKYITYKYISQYWENGKYVPMYFVCGEKDSGKWASAVDWDRYLTRVGYDAMVVEYLGRGHESFKDEIHNLFTWMDLHKRDFFPKEFTANSLRPWDNFFWWAEVSDAKDINTTLPAEWGDSPVSAKRSRPAETRASMLNPNGVSVKAGSYGNVRVWLSPEIVSFNSSLKVVINDKPQRRIEPSFEVLLEDVRRRGDRQHPFWAVAEN